MTDLQGLGRARSRPTPRRFWKSEMKIIWSAAGFTARVSDESGGYAHFAYRETRERETGGFMTDFKFGSWKEILRKTLDETDPDELAKLVPAAELAIFKRRQQLYNAPQHSEELSAMCVASEALRVVKHEITNPRVLGPSKGNAARFAKFVRRSGAA